MVDAAYFRRQAAICRALASDSTRKERCFLDLAEHFGQRAVEIEAKSGRGTPRHVPTTSDRQDA